ncbi:MAG TPA: hypothetical protein VJM14_16175 [Burkholderiales bacterium]|nr:hypothetical protein [Burkholderiales bacterium]
MQGEPRTLARGSASPVDRLTTWALGPAPAPRLAPGERPVTEVALGRGDTAVLTDRRVLVVGRNFERSLPLAHLALVHVRFERIVGEIVAGGIAIVLALILFAVASPVRTFFLNQALSLESAVAQERASASAAAGEGQEPAPPAQGQGLAQGLQKLMGGFAAAARAIPLVGWLLLAFAAAKIALGIFGRTVVVFTAGGSDLTFRRRGRDRLLREFITEVGGHLPGPARPGAPLGPAASPPPTVPPSGPGRT